MNGALSPSSLSSVTLAEFQLFLEQACVAYAQNADQAAMAFIQAFQTAKQPYKHCYHILTHSHNQQSLHAALASLKTAIIREWKLIAPTDRQQHYTALLSFLQSRSQQLDTYVSNQCIHVLVIINKRQWIDQPDAAHRTILHTIQQLLTPSPQTTSSPATFHLLALHFMETLLVEFSATRFTAVGLSIDSHLRCHVSFEKTTLLPLFTQAVQFINTLLSQTELIATRSGQPVAASSHNNALMSARLLIGCLSVLENSLTWDFNINFADTIRSLASDNDDSSFVDAILIQPDETWSPILTQSSLLQQLIQAYHVLSALPSSDLFVTLHRTDRVRNCLTSLASIRGAIFHSQRQEMEVYVNTLIQAVNTLVSETGMENEAIQGMSWIYGRIIQTYSLSVLLNCPAFSALLSCLFHLTSQTLNNAAFVTFSFASSTDTELNEALESIITAWATLITQMHDMSSSSPHSVQYADMYTLLRQYADRVFSLYVERRLQREARAVVNHVHGHDGVDTEEEQEEEEQFAGVANEDDQFAGLAALARLQPEHTLTAFNRVLQQLLTQQKESMQNHTTTSTSSTFALNEHLFFVFRLLTAILTDPAEGETPLVPAMLVDAVVSGFSAVPIKPLILTAASYLYDVRSALAASGSVGISSVVCSTALTMMNRICQTYLLPDSSLYSSNFQQLSSVFLTDDAAHQLVNELLLVLNACLFHWAEEQEVQQQTLAVLSTFCHSASIRSLLTTCAPYQHLLHVYQACTQLSPFTSSHNSDTDAMRIQQCRTLLSLPFTQLRELVSLLFIQCTNTQQYEWMLNPIQQRFYQLTQRAEFQTHYLRSEVMQHLSVTLQMMSSIAMATVDYLFEQSFTFLSSFFPPILHLLTFYTGGSTGSSTTSRTTTAAGSPTARHTTTHDALSVDTSLITSILILFQSIAEHQLSFMSRAQSAFFLQYCLQLVRSYVQLTTLRIQACSQIQGSSKRVLQQEWLTSEYVEEVELLFGLLQMVVQKDMMSIAMDSIELAGEACLLALATFANDTHCLQLLLSSSSSSPSSSSSSSPSSSSPSSSSTAMSGTVGNINRMFFELLQETVTTHTALFLQLPLPQCQLLCQLITHTLQSMQTSHRIMKMCLQCVNAIATYHIKHPATPTTTVASPTASAATTTATAATELNLSELLVQWQSVLFQVILYQHLPLSIVDVLSDALLPCIIAAPEQYAQIAHGVVDRWQAEKAADQQHAIADVEQLSRLRAGFIGLLQNNGVQQTLTISNKQKFRGNVKQFVETVRVIIQYK